MDKEKKISKDYKMNAKMYIAVAALGVIATTALIAGITYADTEGWRGSGWREKGERLCFSPEKEQAVLEAIENNDYNAWREAIGDRPITDMVTEENFGKIVEMHNLIKEGEIDEAQVIADELGVKRPGGKMMNGNFGKKGFMRNHEEAREAMDSGNYAAWLEAVDGSPIADQISEEDFSKLVEAHNLMQAGDFEGAREIREDLGLNVGRGLGVRGMHK